jgi:hypothetical protein
MVMLRPITPEPDENPEEELQHPTPVKTKLRIVTRFCQDNHIDIHQKQINA